MKLHTKFLSIVLMSAGIVAHSHDHHNQSTEVSQQTSAPVDAAVAAPHVHACACGPVEHWFQKSCVNNYIAQFPNCGLLPKDDTEGLAKNIVDAINLLAADILFVAQDGTPIIPVINAKGKLALPVSKNPDVKLCKQILRKVDVTTTLTAQELYEQWKQALQAAKAAQ